MNGEMSLVLKALADPSRLHIVQFLGQVCCQTAEVTEDGGVIGPTAGEVCCHITGQPVINSTISHHLAELEAAGLIERVRRGKTTMCVLKPEKLKALANDLLNLSQGTNHGCC
jgi:DNA-binding transcriptional ArsR family regulator